MPISLKNEPTLAHGSRSVAGQEQPVGDVASHGRDGENSIEKQQRLPLPSLQQEIRVVRFHDHHYGLIQ